MGSFGNSKKESKENADRCNSIADEEVKKAKGFRAEAEKVRKQDKKASYPDPAAVKSITRNLEQNAKICDRNASDFRKTAAENERQSKRWF